MTIGPGYGTLMGLAWGDRRNEQDYQRARAQLTAQHMQAEECAMAALAQKDAAGALLGAIVREIAAVDASPGRFKQAAPLKGFCLPQRRSARVEAYLETAQGQLGRLSLGRKQFKPHRLAGLKSRDCEISALRLLSHRDIENT